MDRRRGTADPEGSRRRGPGEGRNRFEEGVDRLRDRDRGRFEDRIDRQGEFTYRLDDHLEPTEEREARRPGREPPRG